MLGTIGDRGTPSAPPWPSATSSPSPAPFEATSGSADPVVFVDRL
jgi:hypothetical protein